MDYSCQKKGAFNIIKIIMLSKKHFEKLGLSVLCLLIAASFVFLYKYLNVDNPDFIVELNEEEISCELDDFFKSTDVYVCNDIENEILCKKYNIDLDESESILISMLPPKFKTLS